jgi:hypothetical protein
MWIVPGDRTRHFQCQPHSARALNQQDLISQRFASSTPWTLAKTYLAGAALIVPHQQAPSALGALSIMTESVALLPEAEPDDTTYSLK